MSLGPLNRHDAQPKPSVWRRWLRRCRRARIVLALLILIGITTPHATSAPAEEAQAEPASTVSSTFALDHPPTIMLIGAAMLMLAGALRRSESSKFRG